MNSRWLSLHFPVPTIQNDHEKKLLQTFDFKHCCHNPYCKSVMASAQCQRTSLSKNQGEHIVRFCSMYYIWIISGSETNLKPGTNVKIEKFNACCRDLMSFPSTVRGAQDLAQRRKLIETSEFQSKEYTVFLNMSRCLIVRVNRQLGSNKIFFYQENWMCEW